MRAWGCSPHSGGADHHLGPQREAITLGPRRTKFTASGPTIHLISHREANRTIQRANRTDVAALDHHPCMQVELPLDVLDDFTSEAAEVAKCGNGWVAYSPALHMVREFGTLVGLLDLLDERRLVTQS